MPTEPSTSDSNVGRARQRVDRLTDGQRLAAANTLGRFLSAQSRQPFRELLADLIGAKPTPEAIARFADKYPDRWAQAVSIVAGLAGYERGVIEVNVLNVKSLSDSDLMRRLNEVEAQLVAARGPRRLAEVADAEIIGQTGKTAAP